MDEKPQRSPIARQFTGLPLKALLGAPLKAAVDANGMMARSQTQFLLSTCFEKIDEQESALKPIMIRFSISRNAITDGSTVKQQRLSMEMEIPLLTLIPLSSLAVQNLSVAFEMEVKSATQYSAETSKDSKKATENNLTNQYRGQQFTSELHGEISSSQKKQGASSSAAKYEVKLEAGQLPLPKGVVTLINAFNNSFAPVSTK